MLELNTWWTSVKDFFKRSWTLVLARLEAAIGLLLAVLATIDWTPLISLGDNLNAATGLDWRQTALIGAIMFVKGLITEWARRHNTEFVDGHLLPVEIAEQEVK